MPWSVFSSKWAAWCLGYENMSPCYICSAQMTGDWSLGQVQQVYNVSDPVGHCADTV